MLAIVEVAADELHTLESEEQVFLRVCLLVGQAKSALADDFSSTYLSNRMRIDKHRLRLVRICSFDMNITVYSVPVYDVLVMFTI